jgi:hypothetical protein
MSLSYTLLSNYQSDRVLILSCSRTKRTGEELLPAIERYDGPTFRVLRRFLSQSQGDSIKVYVLSGKFGLIPGSQLIPDYDCKLTKTISAQIKPSIISTLETIRNEINPKYLLICVTQLYLDALESYQNVLSENTQIKVAAGTLGRKLSILSQWLYRSSTLHSQKSNVVHSKLIKINNLEFDLRNVNILETARRALDRKLGDPYNYQTWYVLLDGYYISPKWLVSVLTGLPVSSFHSQAARRVLHQLGFTILSNLEKD